MDKARKTTIKRIIALVCIVAVVGLLAAMPLIAKQDTKNDGPKASILSATATKGSVQTKLLGGGTLAEEDAVAIDIPSAVKLTAYLVTNGDTVKEGDPIASVDRVTVMTAISQVQETLDHLSERIEEEKDKETDGEVAALAGGIVKAIYAVEGQSVQDVLLEHGALAVLSLDGKMAVDLTVATDLAVGDQVAVTLKDGTAVAGKIEANLDGKITVCVEDDGYAMDQTVTVTTEKGKKLGSGKLYIYNPWNATAYAGTVKSISVTEGETVSVGEELMVLNDEGYTATYHQLVGQRQEYEDLMLDLFKMYQTQQLVAPCDGIVSGVDKDSLQLLSTHNTTTPSTTYPSTDGAWGSMGEYPQTEQEEFELYSLQTTQVAAVTPQSTFTLDITIDELDITALAVGMDAEIKVNALGGEKFAAKITDIGNTGSNNGGSSKFTVELTLDQGENMLVGMNATASILLETSEDVVTIPAKVLVEDGTKTVVYTAYDEEEETLTNPVVVTVGVSDGEMVEILDGLESGQTYYYAYYDTLEISYAPDFGGFGGFGGFGKNNGTAA